MAQSSTGYNLDPPRVIVSTYTAAAGVDRVDDTTDQLTHTTKHTFYPGDLAVGDMVDVTAFFEIPSANGTDTLTIWAYLDGTNLFGASFSDPLNSGQVYTWTGALYVTAIGAAGSVHADGGQRRTFYTTTGAPVVDFAVDMSTAFDLDFRTQWNAANALNIVDMRALHVRIHRGG